MDRISKFRRKPKPPAIETAIARTKPTATVTQNVAVSDASSPTTQAQQQQEPEQQQQQQPQPQPQPKPSKIATFKNLRLRGPAKRRDEPPAVIPPTSPPPSQPSPAIVAQGPMSPRMKTSRPTAPPDKMKKKKRNSVSEGNSNRTSSGSGSGNSSGASNSRSNILAHRPALKPPKFLALSNQEIKNKFHELTWAERNRIAQGLRNEGTTDCPWTVFKQDETQAQQKGLMDRYINIKPWNHNRVRLRVPETELDYVNASTIVLQSPSDKAKPPLRYIAMQGPTEPSFDYVWRMIAEQTESPAVIVQLTSMHEAGAIKCDQYFPFEGGEEAAWDLNPGDSWGDGWKAQLTYDSLENLHGGAIEKRKLLLSVRGEREPRVIWHLLYRRWPDFGVPGLEDLDAFFELMKLSQKLSSPASARVVHCSAGVGRTGTFICLEHLMRELESGALERHDSPREGADLVYETVDVLRQQRRGMVQGDVQYKFIYQVMRKLWQDKYSPGESEKKPGPVGT